MKNIIKKSILSCIIAAAVVLPGVVQAQPKIATIDMRKVFDNYYKTKQASAALKDQRADIEKQLKQMSDDYKKRVEEYNALNEKANDQAISAEERAKNKKDAEKKYLEVRDTEQTAAQFERSSNAKLKEEMDRKRERIVEEIRGVINAKAKASSFTLVVDTAGESINSMPIVLYSNGENDITEVVLGQLNAAASAATGKADDTKTNATPSGTK